MYMWVTNNYLEWGLWLVRELGFEYKTNLPWVKSKMGIGQYFRGQHELCLFAKRGKGYEVCTKHPDGRRVTCTTADFANMERDRSEHSAKPFAQYAAIEKRSVGPYLEMFARVSAPGWDVWGLESVDRLTDEERVAVAEKQ